MIKIYQDSENRNGYFIREGSRVAWFDKRKGTIESNEGVRMQLILKTYSVMKLMPGTKEYDRILGKYEDLLADLPLPHRYGFRVLKEAPIRKMEEQAKELRINPHWHSA